jgi:chromosome segregation protein
MKLRTLRIHGFKSFADRTQLEFRDGITAIVGSNGCGKSNIADAIRWVLGEQRASAIRGAKMDELIFQGTTRRRPLNFAEVTLLFSNEQGRVALPQTEIEIARKTFREGGSEYSLNRTACRLRDIHGLLRGTGLGSNAYSIIEAGMIETLLSERAEERRSLFEEAAGIGRYKDSRQATTRRLAAAEADLTRLGDLVAEVEAKVRSLARQRRKAQRLQELQARRLDLEVAVVRHEIGQLEEVLQEGVRHLAALETGSRSVRELRLASESRLDRSRAEAAELTRRQGAVVARLDELRQRLHAREREVLLADERRSNAELRIAQLVRERAEQERRRTTLAAEAERLAADRARHGESLAEARDRLDACTSGSAEVRALLAGERRAADVASARSRDLARDATLAEADREALEARGREAAAQIGRLQRAQHELAAEISRLDTQTDLWSEQSLGVADRLAAAEGAADHLREEIRLLRRREAAGREALRNAEARRSRLAAQVEAREALERSYEGFAPAVTAIMAARDRFPGVFGPLADFVATTHADPGGAATIELFLGPLLQALVVEDLATARALRHWFRGEWQGGGSLLLLPLDVLAVDGPPAGHTWVEALLGDLEVVGDADPLSTFTSGRSCASAAGDILDTRGVVRLAERGEGEGILARRERLAALRVDRDAALAEYESAAAECDTARELLTEAEDRAREVDELRRSAAAELQRLRTETAAHGHRLDRLRREREDLARTLAGHETASREAAERHAALEERLGTLRRALGEAEAAAAAARERLAQLEEQWEAARDEEAEYRVAVARAEAEVREVERRFSSARQGAEAARARTDTLDAEARELRQTLESLSGVRERAREEMQQLLAARDLEAEARAALDARLAELEVGMTAAEEQVRQARQREHEAAEERHRLELGTAEARSQATRARERLEAEWGRPFEALVAAASPLADGEPEAWRAEARETAAQLEALGPVNMLAVEEYAEESRRLEFLLEQQKDLLAARDDLVSAIRQINRTAREVFLGTFTTIRENFQRTFPSLFQGGECDVWLADPSDPLESPIEIHASPRGKKTQRIHLLSGGERTLTALALLFAIYLVKPSPFCVLDEVDAPLDESNVGRFLHLLQDFKADTQFVVITHNTRTMEAADWVYGITMQEAGVSSLVGVELEGAWAQEGRVA